MIVVREVFHLRPESMKEARNRVQAMMAVNARGPYVLAQAALPHLLDVRGTIVNLASTAGVIGQAYCSAYCASKCRSRR